jgi:hypothetical protein
MKYIFILLVITLPGCKQTSKKTVSVNPTREKYTRLLSKFKEISFDTLAIFSMAGNNEEQYKYEGVQLDSSDAILFPENVASAHFSNPPGLFACYKFSLDSARTCLIARTPSEYAPTSIKLFVHTVNKDTLIQLAELAEFSGDAGAFKDINSWLFNDSDKKIKAFIWSVDGTDNSVEDPKDKTISTWNRFSIYDIATDKYDEMDTAMVNLPLPFQKLVTSKHNR